MKFHHVMQISWPDSNSLQIRFQITDQDYAKDHAKFSNKHSVMYSLHVTTDVFCDEIWKTMHRRGDLKPSQWINSLAPRRCGRSCKNVICETMLPIESANWANC